MDERTVKAIDAFVSALPPACLPPAARVLLYGSRARGDFLPESDADLAVVLPGEPPKKMRMQFDFEMRDTTYGARAAFGFLVSPIIIWEESLAHPNSTDNPAFYKNVLRDGIEWEGADAIA